MLCQDFNSSNQVRSSKSKPAAAHIISKLYLTEQQKCSKTLQNSLARHQLHLLTLATRPIIIIHQLMVKWNHHLFRTIQFKKLLSKAPLTRPIVFLHHHQTNIMPHQFNKVENRWDKCPIERTWRSTKCETRWNRSYLNAPTVSQEETSPSPPSNPCR